jgi:hypothetical protein
MPTLLQSVPVDGPHDRRARVLFYDDGSIRIRISNAAPMKLSEAFMSGKGDHVILKLDPAAPLQPRGTQAPPGSPSDERQDALTLLEGGESVALAHRVTGIGEQLRSRALAVRDAHVSDDALFSRIPSGDAPASAYAPIYEQLLDEARPEVGAVVGIAAALIEAAPERLPKLARTLEQIFETPTPLNVRMYDAGAAIPAFVAATTGSILLGIATAHRRFDAFAAIVKPRYRYAGTYVSWALSNDFLHPTTLGRYAHASGAAVVHAARPDALGDLGLGERELREGLVGANLLLGVACAAGANQSDFLPVSWAALHPPEELEQLLRDLATDEDLIAPLATMLGESVGEYRARFVGRYRRLRSRVARVRPEIHLFVGKEPVLELFGPQQAVDPEGR